MSGMIHHAKLYHWLIIVLLVLVLTGCAIQPTPDAYDPPGFFLGILHGFTMFFALIGSLFMEVRIYSFPNSGFFYDLGYMVGVAFSYGLTIGNIKA